MLVNYKSKCRIDVDGDWNRIYVNYDSRLKR